MTQLLNDFLSGSAAWGVLLTLAAFALGTLINKLTGKAIFNPLLLGSIFVIVFLSVCKIPYADYKISAAPVNYLLLPATVALAIPLYEKTGYDSCQQYHKHIDPNNSSDQYQHIRYYLSQMIGLNHTALDFCLK